MIRANKRKLLAVHNCSKDGSKFVLLFCHFVEGMCLLKSHFVDGAIGRLFISFMTIVLCGWLLRAE